MGNNHDLTLGKEREQEYTMPYDIRLQNMVVYGAKGSGKSRYLLPYFAKEQLEDRDSGATFICGKGDVSWLIYQLAKKYSRKVHFLTPSLDEGTNDLINLGLETGHEMEKNVLNYHEAVKEKDIVIIDLELSKTRHLGEKALTRLLYHLQRAMVENTAASPHFVYFDDSERYIPYIHDLLYYGKEYCFGTTLFLQSYSLLDSKSKELTSFLNANCASTLAMGLLAYDDINYFHRRFRGDMKDDKFRHRNLTDIVLETVVKGKREVVNLTMKFIPARTMTEFEEEANILKTKKKGGEMALYSEGNITHFPTPAENTGTIETVHSGFRPPARMRKVFLSEQDYFSEE